jgi:UDP-glucose:(heptosyl)LPS alpha-1,3-glucosyltransferase
MRIAIPLLQYSKEGGIERHTWEMVDRWSRKHDIHIFTNEWVEPSQNVTFHKVPALKKPGILRTPSFVLNNSLMLKKSDFDIVFNNGCGATCIQDIIVAASLHKAWAVETRKSGLKRFFLNPLHYWTFTIEKFNYKKRKYKKIIAISEFIKRHLIHYYGLPGEDIVVIHHGVDLEEFTPSKKGIYRSDIRRGLGISEDDLLLVFTGKEFRRKGLLYVFEALSEIKDKKVKLLVIGAGEIGQFKNIALKLGIEKDIVFLGHSPEVAKYYAASDAFVFPSTFDAFGMVVLEAMACGLPVIVSPTAGASELVDNMKEGVLLRKYDDITGLVENIKLLLNNPDVRNDWGINARLKAEKHSWDKVADDTLKVISDVYGSKLKN